MERLRNDERALLIAHEAVLLDRWKRGDNDAINELIAENMPVVERLALKLTGDMTLAEDVVSEALVRAFRAAAHFQGGAQFKTWLHRIVVNCVCDMRRHHHLRTVSLDDLHPEEDGSLVHMQLADGGIDALEQLLEAEQLDSISRSIEELEDDQKNLVYLFHGQGIGYQGIASVLHAPVGTVKSRLHRVRRSIKDHVEREEKHGPHEVTFGKAS